MHNALFDQQSQQTHMDQLRNKVAAKKQRRELINMLGDTEADWHDTPTAQEILAVVKHALANKKQTANLSEQYIARFGSERALLEQLNRVTVKS